jgi:hypothetical protein
MSEEPKENEEHEHGYGVPEGHVPPAKPIDENFTITEEE